VGGLAETAVFPNVNNDAVLLDVELAEAPTDVEAPNAKDDAVEPEKLNPADDDAEFPKAVGKAADAEADAKVSEDVSGFPNVGTLPFNVDEADSPVLAPNSAELEAPAVNVADVGKPPKANDGCDVGANLSPPPADADKRVPNDATELAGA